MADPSAVTLEEAKGYLRVAFDDDDGLIEELIGAAVRLCADAARMAPSALMRRPQAKAAVLYALAYLYEHREEADHRELALTLRALLQGTRRSVF